MTPFPYSFPPIRKPRLLHFVLRSHQMQTSQRSSCSLCLRLTPPCTTYSNNNPSLPPIGTPFPSSSSPIRKPLLPHFVLLSHPLPPHTNLAKILLFSLFDEEIDFEVFIACMWNGGCWKLDLNLWFYFYFYLFIYFYGWGL